MAGTSMSVAGGVDVEGSGDIGGTADFHYDLALSREATDSRTRLNRVSWRTVHPDDVSAGP